MSSSCLLLVVAVEGGGEEEGGAVEEEEKRGETGVGEGKKWFEPTKKIQEHRKKNIFLETSDITAPS